MPEQIALAGLIQGGGQVALPVVGVGHGLAAQAVEFDVRPLDMSIRIVAVQGVPALEGDLGLSFL
jgi:hypothetical protein